MIKPSFDLKEEVNKKIIEFDKRIGKIDELYLRMFNLEREVQDIKIYVE